jgi:hypothetical protein
VRRAKLKPFPLLNEFDEAIPKDLAGRTPGNPVDLKVSSGLLPKR